MLVIKYGSGRQELWHVTLTSGPPRKLDIDVENWAFLPSSLTLHPDGRRIAFVASAGKQGPEVWMLENILSSLSSK